MVLTLNSNLDTPLVKQLEKQLRKQIQAGQLKPGEKLPSMRKLAEQLNVSVIITKQALNQLTTEGYLQSVPKAGVFVAEILPARNIALILPSIELEQISRMVRSTRQHLPKGFQLVIEAPSTGYDGQIDLLKNIRKPHISGIILPTPALRKYAPLLHDALDPEIPCVQCVFELDDLQLDSVTADGFTMGQNTVQYLIEKGHRKIGLISSRSDSRTFRDRTKGIDFALRQIHLTYDQLPCISLNPNEVNADCPWLAGKNATLELLKKHPDLTAIIGGNGHITLGAIQAINETGRSIPNDISLIAMELDLSAFEHTVPQITAIDKPLERMFERATELLIERIKNPDQPLRTVHLPPVLKERDSVKDIR